MKDFSAWILAMSIISTLYNTCLVMCSSGYEVFHTSGTGSIPDSADHFHENYNQGGTEQEPKQFDLSGYKRISPTPKFTLSHLYISPEDAEPHFTRSVSEAKNGYSDGYSAFLKNNFETNDDDDYVNSKYEQKNDDNDDDDDEDVVSSNYRQAPRDVEENERHHYFNVYNSGDELDRIQSLPQKKESEPAQSFKDCRTVVKGKALCRLCKDPFSGAHSESCSFSSALPQKKYAYIKKAKYVS